MSEDRSKYFKNYNHEPRNIKRRVGYNKLYYVKLRETVLLALGNKCCLCGFSDTRTLQIDHINGGGVKEKKEITSTYYIHVLKEFESGSKKYQLLCANCNWIKRVINKEVRK